MVNMQHLRLKKRKHGEMTLLSLLKGNVTNCVLCVSED